LEKMLLFQIILNDSFHLPRNGGEYMWPFLQLFRLLSLAYMVIGYSHEVRGHS